MKAYHDLLRSVLDNGVHKPNRTGTDTISIFDYHYKLNMCDGFPLLTTKKVNWKSILIENLWFLGGSSSPDFLHRHGVKFWDPWIEGDGNLPEAYGIFWRHYPVPLSGYYGQYGDQFQLIIDELKRNPNSRRLVLTNWHPPSAWQAKLPPCHLLTIFNCQYFRGEPILNLHMTQRSCDVPVGVPFNIAGYSFLLHLVSHLTGIRPAQFGHTLVDAHIYVNQMNGCVEQLSRAPRRLPELIIDSNIKTLENIDEIIRDATTEQIMDSFKIEGYNPYPAIKFPVAV